ncbi:MAG: hypothetical protein KBS67_02075 [Bacteroidales bacterium]|nr:hypothetical protein [Candidatus Cryptobacteroides equifaecalis]
MRTYKIIAVAALAAMLVSCGHYVPKSQYDEVVAEYEELKESSDATNQNYINQAKALDNIFTELSSISRKTSSLKVDVESGSAELSQADQIQSSINDIKDQLAELDKLTRKNRQLAKVVSDLRNVIADKEKEIADLKTRIAEMDVTISDQKNTIRSQEATISSQEATIDKQRQALQRQVAEQAKLLYEAGLDFEEIADASPETSFKKNKEKVKNWAQSMYEKALLYYGKALEAGYQEAEEGLVRVKEKLQ